MEEKLLFLCFEVEYNFNKKTAYISELCCPDKTEFKNVELNEVGNILKDICDSIAQEYEK